MVVGLTGGIGSGKSTVSAILRLLDVPIYDSDFHAKQIMHNEPRIINSLKNRFGESIYDGGYLNRKKLSEVLFSDVRELNYVNELVHPYVKSDFLSWVDIHRKQSILVMESAILFESGSYLNVDKVLLVVSPLSLRICRVMKRDHCTFEDVKLKIQNQLTDEERLALSTDVIYSDDIQFVVPQVEKWYSSLLQLIK